MSRKEDAAAGKEPKSATFVAFKAPRLDPGCRPLVRPVYPVTLKFEDVAYKVKLRPNGGGFRWYGGGGGYTERTIISGITGVVYPGEMLGMLGPSGSGKTTLLTALGGRLQGKLEGKISYNGQPLTGSMRRRTGFVSQDDVLYPHLTVSETLLFTALLRLPGSLTRQEKEAQVQRVISELGLARCAHSMIGGPLFRGISGGEKKRVSIGQEMLINPSLLLLDEPTSGLDSTTAQRILSTVKRLAAGGRTVVTTIHQPSSRLYHMFDKVVLLSEGRPMYSGPGSAALDYFAAVGFRTSVTVNLADLMLDLANGLAPEAHPRGENTELKGSGTDEDEQKLVKALLLSAYEKNIAPKLKAEQCSPAADPAAAVSGGPPSILTAEQWSISWWAQFEVLLSRSLKERRYEVFNYLRIFQVVSVAVLAGLLWWQTPPSHIQDRISLVFFFAVFWGFFPLYNSVFTFPQERAMLMKERSSGMYRLSSYFLARTAGDLPMELALPSAFVVILYWMGGLKPEPLAFFFSLLIVLFSVLVAQSLGLAIGAILMDIKQGTTLASVTTLVFLVAGGFYVQHTPGFIQWFKYLSYSYYCYKLLLAAQFSEHDYYECSEGVMCRVIDFPSIKSVDLGNIWSDVFIMLLMLLGYRFIAYLALHRMQTK